MTWLKRLVAIAIVAGALFTNLASASAHSPRCDDKYPYFQYKTTVHAVVMGTVYYKFWFYNASTGSIHYDICVAGE